MKHYNQQSVLFSLSVPAITIIVSILPVFATFFAVGWSVLFDFEESTKTHCKVYNFLPSISAAIGGFTPQKYVWRICIALHCAPRFLLALSYYGFHSSLHTGMKSECLKSMAALCSGLYVGEICALVGLSYISSSENFEMHKFFFCTFIFCFVFYMLLTCFLMSQIGVSQGRPLTPLEKQSLSYKKKLAMFNIGMILLCVYFYNSHSTNCSDRTYSYFALCEYCVIFSNIAFHATAILDFKSTAIIIEEPSHLHAYDNIL